MRELQELQPQDKDKFNKPVIIISIEKDIGKASARSIVGFDIGSATIAATQENILMKGGGHKMAGGFTIKVNQIENLRIYFKKFANNQNLTKQNHYILIVLLPRQQLILNFITSKCFSPIWIRNPEPKFVIENLKCKS